MRRLASAGRLLAYAPLAVDHGWLQRRELQAKADVIRHRRQDLALAFPTCRPVPVPYAPLRKAGAGDGRTCPIQTLAIPEALPVNVGEGQVRRIEIVYAPDGGVIGRPAPFSLAE